MIEEEPGIFLVGENRIGKRLKRDNFGHRHLYNSYILSVLLDGQ